MAIKIRRPMFEDKSSALYKGEKEVREILEQGLAVGMNPLNVVNHANKYMRALGAAERVRWHFEQHCGKLMEK